MDKQYHINVSSEDIEESKHLLICGDPGRVPRISSLLKDPREISFNREYRIHLGYINEHPVLVSFSSASIFGVPVMKSKLMQ